MVMLYSWYMALYGISCPSLCVQGLLFCFSASCYYKPSALQFCLEHVLRLNKKAETHAICVFFKMNSICFFVFFNVCCLRRYNDNIVFNVFTRLLSRRNFLQQVGISIHIQTKQLLLCFSACPYFSAFPRFPASFVFSVFSLLLCSSLLSSICFSMLFTYKP